jgi:hypothetical protein
MKIPLSLIVRISVLSSLGLVYPIHVCARSQSDAKANSVQSDSARDESERAPETILIPGPLRSFLRMAAISQEISPDEVLPMLARNASLYGYTQGKETEFLVLVDRYVHQATDLQHFADANGTIRISGCNDAAELLNILGYRLQQGCGQKKTVLVTANSERAFLTIDSGFPLTALEKSLEMNKPFSYSYPATRVRIFFQQKEWTSAIAKGRKSDGDLLDDLLHDPDLDRLYAAMAKCDRETRLSLLHSPGLKKLLPVASVFDLYGGQIAIKSGRVIVPGGAEKEWADLAGASPRSPGEFVSHLLTKDGGWLAAYYDVMARLSRAQVAPLMVGNRLRRFYEVYRSTAARFNASKGVYPRNADLLLLLSSLNWQPDGDFSIPGGLDVWNGILAEMARSGTMRPWLGHGRNWNTSGRLLETLVASSNRDGDSGPVQIFLFLSAIDAARGSDRQLSIETDKLVAAKYRKFKRWFPIFAEFPLLDDTAIAHFVSAADRIDAISNASLRANALGSFQADIGLWQILARQGQIPADQLNTSWQNLVQPFLDVSSSVQLFEAARNSLQSVFAATGSREISQDKIIDLLAGPVRDDPDGQRVHHEMAEKIRAVLDDQRLASLDTLFGLYDGMVEMAGGAPVGKNLLPLAEDLREFELPRPIFTGSERASWSPIVYTNRHAELQVRTDLTRILKSSASPSQLQTARGQLTPFLRDTLVGLNYAYYEPPGAQVLHNNPLFVRSHDFASVSILGDSESWGTPRLIGVGAMAGGGAFLLGSLADLPYALASTEQDFIVPRNVQALIWREVVPNLLVDSVLPRWWNVSKTEMHFASLYQRSGEELLIAAAANADLRSKVLGILADRMEPAQLEMIKEGLQTAQGAATLVSQTPPSDLFYLAAEFRKQYPNQSAQWGEASNELEALSEKDPEDGSWKRLSADFGIPHPALMLTNSCSLLDRKAVSTYEGDSGMLFAESWDSNNLYWARLADEAGYSPATLNILVPQLTRSMIRNIFASNIDDWPALLRAMEETGSEFRQGKITPQVLTTIARQ